MEPSNRHESGSLSAFITGALVGAGIALLFAPQSGAQMRGLLRDYASRAKDELDEVVDHGAEVLDHTVDRGHDLVEKGKESLRETGRQAKEFAEAGRKAAHETKDELMSQPR
jgi:gas vesicle protein